MYNICTLLLRTEILENSIYSNLGLWRYGDDVNLVGNADQSSYGRVPNKMGCCECVHIDFGFVLFFE